MEANGHSVFGGRFRAARLLKRGLGVETLLGTDLADSKQVIIKLARVGEFSIAAQHRLEHEAAVLRELRSPWLTPLLHFGRDETGMFLVTRFVHGTTLEARLGRGALSVDETVAVGRCLFPALQEAHERGILHRDVKPSNVIVDDARPLERATLIDFGLARSLRLRSSIRDQPVGTVRYMSPEQAGILRHDVGPRSDLYSAGIVLFECLAGRPPFLGDSVSSLLRQHLAARPPELRSLGLSVPRALEELIKRLLRKDPRERYQSAEAVLADLQQIAEALSRGVAEPELVVGVRDRRRTISEPAFVGRRAELEAFDATLEQARTGKGGLLLVEAESGGGKSRLLDEFALHAAQRGAWTLRGQTLDQIARRPLEVLAGVVAELLASVHAEPGAGEAVRKRIGDSAAAATTALPELSKLFGDRPQISLGPEAHGEARTLAALVALVDAVGSTNRPAVILLDDCQWADELTIKLLAERQRRQLPSHTVVVVAFRSEEVSESHLLRTVAASVRLAPLAVAEVRGMVESMAGPLPEEAVDVVCQVSEGSPFLAAAVLEGLVETGALRASADGWAVEPRVLADAHSSRRAAAVLARRLERLPAGTRRLLTAGAVLGRKFDLDDAGALSGDPVVGTIEAAAEARRRRFIWASGDGTHFTFVHDKIRDALLSQLPPDERRALHHRAAARLESEGRDRIFELAYHFDAAGELERAFPYAVRAAAQARSQHALQAAELHYRIARRGAEAADDETRRRIAEGLGEVLMLRGTYDEAARYLREARELAPTELARAHAETKIGELVFKKGDVLGSAPIFEGALRFIGRPPPTTAHGLLWMIVRELVVQVFHTMLPRLFVGRRSLEGAERDLLEVRIYGRLAICNHIGRGALWTVAEGLRQLNLAERYPPTPELAQAYSTHGAIAQTCHLHRRAVSYGKRSLELRIAQGDIWGQGQSLHFLGITLFGASKFRESIQSCRDAIRLLERAGDRWEENTARFHVAMSHYYLGELQIARDEAGRNYQLCKEIGDFLVAGSSLKPLSLGSGGDVLEELTRAEMSRPDQAAQTVGMLAVADAVRLLHARREREAVAVLEHGRRQVWQRGLLSFHISDLFAWLATARRVLLERTRWPEGLGRRTALRKAARAARLAVWVGRLWRSDLPHALREAGLVAAIRGRERLARRLFESSLAEAERLGERCERAQTLLAAGRVGSAFGWPGASERSAAALAELRAAGAALALGEPVPDDGRGEPTLSLADRFATLLESGRKMASALTRETIFEAIRESALALLRGERCILVEIGEGGAPAGIAGDEDGPYSRTLAERAVAAGRPLLLSEELSDDAGDSAILAGVRSALCAPIFVRGRARLCLYTTHAHVGGLFEEDDQRLAGFIAAIAGAALENAEGFAEVQVLTRTLERRVDERTAQLLEANRELAANKLELEKQNANILRATEHKSAFLANMSHELRTPLNAILGFTRLALKKSGDGLPSVQRENLKKVEKSAVDLIGIVNDVLDLAKVEAGKLTVRAERFLLGELLEEVIASAAPLVGERPLALHRRGLSPLPEMLTDRLRLRQIVLNLVFNAINFTPSGTVTIEVEHDAETDRVRIAVIDTGVGIADADRERVFEPFDQADAPGARASGTGLGLAIVRRLCHLLGGSVALHSIVGSGSRFMVDVPRALESTSASEPARLPPVGTLVRPRV